MTKFQLLFREIDDLDLSRLENQYNVFGKTKNNIKYHPYNISKLQKYNPIFSDFLKSDVVYNNKMALDHRYHIHDLETIIDMKTQILYNQPVHVKFSPLLDPARYMIGKYDINDTLRELPNPSNIEKCISKLSTHNNASYVDNFFCYLSSQVLHTHGILHCIDYYGSFLGIQEKYMINIADDNEYLHQSDFFHKHRGVLFDIDETNEINDDLCKTSSHGNKNRIIVCNDFINLDDIQHLETIDLCEPTEIATSNNLSEIVYEKQLNTVLESESDSDSDTDSDTDSKSVSSYETDSESIVNSASLGSEDDENDTDQPVIDECDETMFDFDCEQSEESNDSVEPVINAYIHNFPVQMICLEKCEGTLDELFEMDSVNIKNGASILFQIIMTLCIYQKLFKFTHNDLHTNNIMYVKTKMEFLYYKLHEKYYKVPTYGRIFKIIDFGRSIYKYNSQLYCSDSFGPSGDGAGQYNFEPYMNDKKTRLEPNYSFDLCRLGCSIFDFIINDGQNLKTLNELQQIANDWCMDDKKRNVLYKSNGDERYPGFKLYKMIARNVHDHTPANQLKNPYFSQFAVDNIEDGVHIMDIDNLPTYW